MAGSNIACIDIGSCKICTILARVNDGQIVEVFGVGQAASRGIQKGVVVNIEDASRAVRESVENAQGNAMPKVGSILVGFSGKHISSVNTVVTVDNRRTDHLITEAVIKDVRKKIESASVDEGQVGVNIVERQFAVDRVAGVTNPLGMHGFRLDVEAHVVTVDTVCMRSLVACLDRAGVSVSSDSFVANPLASSEAVLEPEERARGAIVVDIGGGTTGIAVFKDGIIWQTAILPVGGRQVTSDLAMALSIPFRAAEEVKVKCGNLFPEKEVPPGILEMTQKYNTSADWLSYVIAARVEEILRMVKSKASYLPDILVLTGGSSNLPGMARFAQEVLGLRARVGTPLSLLPKDAKGLDDPAYAAGVGLLRWDIEREFGQGGAIWGDGLKSLGSGFRSTLVTVWSRRPRVVFGPPGLSED